MVLASVGYRTPVLRMRSQWTEKSSGGQPDPVAGDQIRKAVNGEVNVKIFPGRNPGKDKENPSLLHSSAIELVVKPAVLSRRTAICHSARFNSNSHIRICQED
ncbi:MAG: hypothetical protein OXI60_01180 [Acidiferrobacterales bacterium]|nr:hypothetical protein [Acidiferrobacterales bacterium]